MSKPLHFLYDIDGVLADSNTVVLRQFNHHFNTHLTLNDITGFEFLFKQALTSSGLEPIEVFNLLYGSKIMDQAKPFPDAFKLTQDIAHQDHQQSIVTSRPHNQKTATVRWLKRHFDWVQPQHVYFMPSTHDPRGGDVWKLHINNQLKPDYYFEDSGDTLQHIVSNISRPTSFNLIDQPWNKSYTNLDKYRTNWKQLQMSLKHF